MRRESPVTIRAARPDDLGAFRRLLGAAGLPDADLAGAFGDSFAVAVDGGKIVGGAGFEVHGTDGLLRSVAVIPSHRGRGIAGRLVAWCVERANARSLSSLFLLTETASDYFPRLGFRVVSRDAVPAAVRASTEFARACPASATAMVLPLRTGTRPL